MSDETGQYKSALDLPSMAEMLRQLQGLNLLTRVIARDQRQNAIKLESELREMAAVIDRFYELLGPRHWVFHESLDMSKIKSLIDLDADEAERNLIGIYGDAEGLKFMIQRLAVFPELRDRMQLIENARQDYLSGRFYATTLVLLTVMDGFVNNLEAPRRALSARTPEQISAWDSIVGHHLGLTNAHETFIKKSFKTSTAPVFELQRHGIIHGNLTNYDNDVVATKAWNRLFAVADWASSLERRAAPATQLPSWRELFKQVAKNAEARKALDEWQPKALASDAPGFGDDEVVQRSVAYLDAWSSKNYGAMAAFLSGRAAEETTRKTAGVVREAYESMRLDSYCVTRVDHDAAASSVVDVEVVVGGQAQGASMRWIRETVDGEPALPNDEGSWVLYVWEPYVLLAPPTHG